MDYRFSYRTVLSFRQFDDAITARDPPGFARFLISADQATPMPTDNDYGYDRFIYIDGVRNRRVLARTLLPIEGETNQLFEERMDHVAKQLWRMAKVESVEVEFERVRGAIVQCLLIVTHQPYPEFVSGDTRPAGGRANSRSRRAA